MDTIKDTTFVVREVKGEWFIYKLDMVYKRTSAAMTLQEADRLAQALHDTVRKTIIEHALDGTERECFLAAVS